MIYIIKQEGMYQNKVNSGLVFTCNCKMGYCEDRGGCFPPRPSAPVDNILLLALHNSSHHTKAEFNNVFIIHSKYFYVLNKLTFSLTGGLFLGLVSGIYRCFSLRILLKKLITYVLPILAFILCTVQV